MLLSIERLNPDAVNKSEILVQSSEGMGIHMCELRINDGEMRSEIINKLAKSHKQDNEAKSIVQIPYVLPDPYHTWYATFTVTQTLRMWMSQYQNTSNIQDRIQALYSMTYFQQPPKKEELGDGKWYTKKHAFADMAKENGWNLEQYIKIGKRGEKKNEHKVAENYSNIEIPKNYIREAKRRMMDYHQEIKKKQIKQDLNPSEGPVDVYRACIHSNSCM